ncbi:putative porin [Salinimonas lutimaris]|uniref:putative porin n=1 Tax=Salinimonas lutimaris TaxID=914153 RepID=UPI001586513B|nr:putative porin [Salinimonas lutimaris]
MFKIRTLVCLSLASSLSFSVVAAQNEISFGVSDQDFIDDSVLNLSYTRYLTDVSNNAEPSLIAPYLQRVNSVTGRVSTSGSLNRYELGGQWFINPEWVISGNARYHDLDDSAISSWYSGDVSLGYFINPKWQVGAGYFYQHIEGETTGYMLVDGEWVAENYSLSDSDSDGALFTRYTDVNNGQGWDLSARVIFSSETRYEADANYFFTKRFSLGLDYTHLSRDHNTREYIYFGDANIASLKSNYWFTNRFSMSFKVSSYIGSDQTGVADINLLANYRF